MKPHVVLSAGNIAHYHYAALALHKAGMLERYLCTFSGYETQSWWGRLLPEKERKRLQGKAIADLSKDVITTIPLPYLTTQVLRRANMLSTNKSNAWASAWYDHASRKHAQKAEIFHYVNSMGLQTAQAVKARGGLTICDIRTEHIDTQETILKTEYATLRLPYQSSRSQLRERIIQEYQTADLLIVPSRYVRQTLIQQGILASRITILPYGANLGQFSQWQQQYRNRQGTAFHILFVGQITPRKGLHYLITAFNSIQLPHSDLWIFGRGEPRYKGMLERMVHPNDKRVQFLGHRPQLELWQYYSQADVFVLPTISEGSALVIYEAMAAGLPVITTPNAGSVVRDGVDGFIVPIRDPQALAEKLVWLYEHPEARREMGRSAAQRVREFTWARYGERLLEVYRKILD